MAVTCILGTQWGDEGKAKLVDRLAADMDVVVRFQGGANAGHTVIVGGKKYVFHMIPTGIIRPHATCVIANGVAFDPEQFFEELDTLAAEGVKAEGRVFVSRRAHVVFPYHKRVDVLREEALGNGKIGTTARGIGPTYSDKMSRTTAVRVADLLDEKRLKEQLEKITAQKNIAFKAFFGKDEPPAAHYIEMAAAWRKRLMPFVTDTVALLHDALDKDKRILLEGAQGSMLDVDMGTYPFVTSSTTVLAGASAGTGIPPRKIDRVIGITKAYCTRVGSGPFPTEEKGSLGDKLREAGGEYGATTGRPRRCGWFDMVAASHAMRVSGVDEIALTKLDVLSELDEIKVCTAYEIDGNTVNTFPASIGEIESAVPALETLPGWKGDISGARKLDDLPEKAREYVRFIEAGLGVPVSMISVGSDREALIMADKAPEGPLGGGG